MSNIWHDISPKRISPTDFVAVVEISKGSKKKYELDKETGLLFWIVCSTPPLIIPQTMALIPRTYGDDLDPLDVLVLCSEPLEPLILVRCYPIGVISMIDSGRNDEKIIAIPYSDPTYNSYHDISELPRHIFDEMSHFFRVYKALEGKETAVNEISGHEEAERIIADALDNYVENFCK